MEFWRAEMLLEIHKEKTEEENKRRTQQENQQNSSVPNMSSMMSSQQNMFKNLTSGGSPFGK